MCKILKQWQEKANNGLAKVFETWAKVIIRCGVFTTVVAVVLVLYVSYGQKWQQVYHWTEFAWAPVVSSVYMPNLCQHLQSNQSWSNLASPCSGQRVWVISAFSLRIFPSEFAAKPV